MKISRNNKKAAVSALLAAALLILGACGGAASGGGAGGTGEAPDKGNAAADAAAEPSDAVLNLAIVSDIVNMDVHRNTNDYLVPMNVFDTLFTIEKNDDGSMSIEKSLVEDYEVSSDGLTYSFTLRDGVVFSDGTPLTADDVKFTFERILTLPDSEQTDYADSIEGASDLMEGREKELKGIKVTDDRHFTVTLAGPFEGFLSQLATPSTSILSRKLVTEAGDDFGIDPAKTTGTGPYIIKSWDRGSGLTFDYNDKYWGSEPSVKHVNVKIMDAAAMDMAFQKGDLDILDCLLIDSAIVDSVYKTKYADQMLYADRLGMNFMMLNEKSAPLSDVNVRKAVQMAIDRRSILDSIYGGAGNLEDGIFPTGCVGYSSEDQGWLQYDPEGAKKLLSDAGYSDGFDLELSLDSSAAEGVQSTVEIIAQDLKDVGINANIRSYDRASYLDLRNSGDMSAYVAMWLLDFNDPDNIIYTFFGSKDNTVLRSSNYPDMDTIARVAGARAIADHDGRMKEYAALEQKLVRDEAVWVPLFSLKHPFVVGERVAEFKPQWAGWQDQYFKDIILK